MDNLPLLAVAFFTTALMYSTAGFGGGSTYLALMMLFAVPFESMRPVALLCNIAVAAFGSWHFARKGHLPFKRLFPFLIASVPMAYLGGTIPIGKDLFTFLLGVSLAIAASRMLLAGSSFEGRPSLSTKTVWGVGVLVGAMLGFFSGLVGIGGGIYLTPVLLFLGWANSKQAAAASSVFILVNSVSGLIGQLIGQTTKGTLVGIEEALPLLVAAVLGGQIGSRLGADTIPKFTLQRISAALILAASGRLLWGLL